MKIVAILICLGVAACANSPLYPGLTFGQCLPGQAGHHTAYDFMGIPECVPNATSAETHSGRWMD